MSSFNSQLCLDSFVMYINVGKKKQILICYRASQIICLQVAVWKYYAQTLKSHLLKCASSHKSSDNSAHLIIVSALICHVSSEHERAWLSIFSCDICSKKLLHVFHSSLILFCLRFTESFNMLPALDRCYSSIQYVMTISFSARYFIIRPRN